MKSAKKIKCTKNLILMTKSFSTIFDLPGIVNGANGVAFTLHSQLDSAVYKYKLTKMF